MKQNTSLVLKTCEVFQSGLTIPDCLQRPVI